MEMKVPQNWPVVSSQGLTSITTIDLVSLAFSAPRFLAASMIFFFSSAAACSSGVRSPNRSKSSSSSLSDMSSSSALAGADAAAGWSSTHWMSGVFLNHSLMPLQEYCFSWVGLVQVPLYTSVSKPDPKLYAIHHSCQRQLWDHRTFAGFFSFCKENVAWTWLHFTIQKWLAWYEGPSMSKGLWAAALPALIKISIVITFWVALAAAPPVVEVGVDESGALEAVEGGPAEAADPPSMETPLDSPGKLQKDMLCQELCSVWWWGSSCCHFCFGTATRCTASWTLQPVCKLVLDWKQLSMIICCMNDSLGSLPAEYAAGAYLAPKRAVMCLYQRRAFGLDEDGWLLRAQ